MFLAFGLSYHCKREILHAGGIKGLNKNRKSIIVSHPSLFILETLSTKEKNCIILLHKNVCLQEKVKNKSKIIVIDEGIMVYNIQMSDTFQENITPCQVFSHHELS